MKFNRIEIKYEDDFIKLYIFYKVDGYDMCFSSMTMNHDSIDVALFVNSQEYFL